MCSKYNGWTNYETWVTNLWYDDAFVEDARQCFDDAEGDESGLTRAEQATATLADIIKDTVEDNENIPESGLTADLLNAVLSSVNWYEIAEHYIDDMESEV